MIDSVLEPLVPVSLRDAEYFVDLTAGKLLEKSTLYDLDNNRLRTFFQQAVINDKGHMFHVRGQHTFFMPVDSAFDASVHVSGYDYERNRLKSDGAGRASVSTVHCEEIWGNDLYSLKIEIYSLKGEGRNFRTTRDGGFLASAE